MASRPDAAATVRLAGRSVGHYEIGWLDFLPDPIRVTTAKRSLTFAGTGDPDLDGFTFGAADPRFLHVSDVSFTDGGAETVLVSLSGLVGPDAYVLNTIGDTSKWQGREARLWRGVWDRDADGPGVPWEYFTGRMSFPEFDLDPGEEGKAGTQTVSLSIETYRAVLAPASNRSYLSVGVFDPADQSERATRACINGISGSTGTGVPYGGGGAGGGGGPSFNNFREP